MTGHRRSGGDNIKEASKNDLMKDSCITTNKLVIPVMLIFSLLLIMGTETLYRDPLYESSFEYIEERNKRLPDFAITTFNLLSDSGGGTTLALYTIILSIWLNQRKKYVYFTLIISVIALMMNTMKMLYKGNRPQWEDRNLTTQNELECSMEYGNPSGHSMIAAALACAILFD